MTTITRNDVLMFLAVSIAAFMFMTWLFYGAIIGAWLGAMAAITAMFMGGAMGLLLLYGAVNGLILTTKKAVDAGYHVAFLNEQLNMAKANTLYRHAEIERALADSDLIRAESVAKGWAITEISHKRGAMVMINGQPTLIPPIEQSAPMLAQGGADFTWDDSKLFDVFRQAKSVHGLIIGARHSGKSTLLNGLMNEVLSEADITLIDPLFNKVESGWLLPAGAKVTRDFIGGLTEFYSSHKRRADNSTTKRESGRKVLVIDETPSLLKGLKANDKETYNKVMAMLRSIYSQGSHTNHNVILLSQTVLSEDLDLSSNDKANFIQVCLGSLAGDYLALRRGKAGKKGLYERLGAVASEFDHYAIFESLNGTIDVQPLPDLSQYGAKRLYGGAADCTSEGIEADSSVAMVADKVAGLTFVEVSESEQAIIDAARGLLSEGQFSFNKLHTRLTGAKVSGGKQTATYKEILAKFGLLEAVSGART